MFARNCCLARLAALIFALGVSGGAVADSIRLGPLFDEFDLTLTLGGRTEAAGPFFNSERQPARREVAIPPLFCHTWYTDADGEEMDFLYPFMTYDRYGQQHRWQFLQLANFSGGPTQEHPMVHRSAVFPFYFNQRSPDPAENYTAVVPFYGTIKHKLMRDEIHFVMFPLYSETRKRDVVTDNYLFPFFHLRHGDGLKGWQFWPLFGAEHKEITTRTNDFGTVETVGGHDKTFAVWPLYFREHSGIGTENPESYNALLPFYSLSRSPKRDVSSYIWPLFNYSNDREQKYREWDFPWPLWVIARGEGKTITRFIPFYSYGHTATMDSRTYLWPIYSHRTQHSKELMRDRKRFGVWLYSKVDEENKTTGTTARRIDGWPLFTHYRTHNGNTRLQILAPLEPILPNSKNVERNYSPLWSLWRSEKNATNGATSQSLLWNLYRRDKTPETKRVSLLLGLFQYKSTPEEKVCRVFFIPISKKRVTAK